MKIINTGTADFIVRDKRGNSVRLEPTQTVEVTEDTARRLAPYSFIKVVKEVEAKPEVPKEVKAEPKKKSKKRKNGVSNND